MEDKEYWKNYEQSVKERIEKAINENGMGFVINMVASFHSTRGGALYNMSDYLNAKGY
ncbi:MAG: hypothetical protein MJ237_06075 [bacterium]|nr:hypothetical protein [bacterium]